MIYSVFSSSFKIKDDNSKQDEFVIIQAWSNKELDIQLAKTLRTLKCVTHRTYNNQIY